MLGRALAMEWVSRVIFLEAAICVGRQPFGVCGEGLSPPAGAPLESESAGAGS